MSITMELDEHKKSPL